MKLELRWLVIPAVFLLVHSPLLEARTGSPSVAARLNAPANGAGSASALHPAMAPIENSAQDKKWIAVWQDKRDSNWSIYSRRLTQDGSVLGVEQRVDATLANPTTQIQNDRFPAIASDGFQTAVVIWQRSTATPSGEQLFYSRTTDGGQTWAAEQSIPQITITTQPGDPEVLRHVGRPKIIYARDYVHVVWTEFDGTRDAVMYSRKKMSDTSAFSTPVVLNSGSTNGDRFGADPTIKAGTAGLLLVAYLSRGSTHHRDVFVRRSIDNGTTFQQGVQVNNAHDLGPGGADAAGVGPGQLAIAIAPTTSPTSGDAMVFWQDIGVALSLDWVKLTNGAQNVSAENQVLTGRGVVEFSVANSSEAIIAYSGIDSLTCKQMQVFAFAMPFTTPAADFDLSTAIPMTHIQASSATVSPAEKGALFVLRMYPAVAVDGTRAVVGWSQHFDGPAADPSNRRASKAFANWTSTFTAGTGWRGAVRVGNNPVQPLDEERAREAHPRVYLRGDRAQFIWDDRRNFSQTTEQVISPVPVKIGNPDIYQSFVTVP